MDKDKSSVIQAIGLLNSMVACGESHSDTSRALVEAALEVLRDDDEGPPTALDLLAAERERQKVGIPCWECKATGRGRERLNHMDNSPTGDYFDCWRCKGTKVTGFDAEHDDKTNSRGQLLWAAICYLAPDVVYRPDGGGHQITFTEPWPSDWDRRWDKRRARPVGLNICGSQLELRIRELVKGGAMVVADLDRQLRTLRTEMAETEKA